MAYRGGGRGDQRQPYGHGRGPGAPGGGGSRPSGFVCPPPPATPRSVLVQYQAATMGYRASMALLHQDTYSAPAVVYWAPAPAASRIVYAPPPAAALVTTRVAPPSSPSAAPAPQGASARTPAPVPASLAPSAMAKGIKEMPFLSVTALAPTAAAVAAGSQEGAAAAAEAASDVDSAPGSKKGLVHPAGSGPGTCRKKVMNRENLVDVADNNLFHYIVTINHESKSGAISREDLSELIKYVKTSLGGKLPAHDGRKSLGSLPFESEVSVVKLVDPEKKDKDRSFLSTSFGHRGDIGEGLESWRGYYQSMCPTQMGLSLNIASFLKPVIATKFVEELLTIRDTSHSFSDRDRVKVCKIVEGQSYSKKLNGRQVCKSPQEREQSIHDMVLHKKSAEDRYAREFGVKSWLKYNDSGMEKTCVPSIKQSNMTAIKMVSVPARVLPPPLLKYNDTSMEKTCVPSVGQSSMINQVEGRNTVIDQSLSIPVVSEVFGTDVTHSPPGEGSASSNVAVFVCAFGQEISMLINPSTTTVAEVVGAALTKRKISVQDVYFKLNGRNLDANQILTSVPIDQNSHIHVVHRMRGGVPFNINVPMVCERVNVLLNLNAHLLFDEVWLPPELLLIGEQHPYRPIYFLGSFAR